jgi:hypothetical protein
MRIFEGAKTTTRMGTSKRLRLEHQTVSLNVYLTISLVCRRFRDVIFQNIRLPYSSFRLDTGSGEDKSGVTICRVGTSVADHMGFRTVDNFKLAVYLGGTSNLDDT